MASSAQHSQTSSLADVEYQYRTRADSLTHSHSTSTSSSSSASSSGAARFPLPPASPRPAHDWQGFARGHSRIPSYTANRPPPTSTRRLLSPIASQQSTPALGHRITSSLTEKGSPRLSTPNPRPHSFRSPRVRQASAASPSLQAEDYTPTQLSYSTFGNNTPAERHNPSTYQPAALQTRPTRSSSIPVHSRYAPERQRPHAPYYSADSIDYISGSSPAHGSHPATTMRAATKPPSMKLEFGGVQRTLTDESLSSLDSPNATRPKSPGGRLGNFFPWKKSGPDSPSTTFSDHSLSPGAGFMRSNSLDTTAPRARLSPPGMEVQKANMHHRREYFENDETPILLGTPEQNAHVKELEKELTQVSTELAESIRREMELEDEIERIRSDPASGPASADATRRSSDAFSDSTGSSTRFPSSGPEARIEQLEQKLRKAEQEKAQIKIEMASRLQVELSRRRDLEIMVHKLEEQFQSKMEEDDQRGDMEERVEELESTLDDTRRLLNQERQAKASFEDLYTATKGELERHVNQHETLRDENTRMQQELSSLKKVHGRFGSIVEEEGPGLARSGSLARNPSRRGGSLSRPGDRSDATRQRSGSTSAVATVEGVKEIEDQRDALHKALKLLIIRSEKQQKEHELAIKKLTSAKNLAELSSSGRGAYHREVAFLKEEVATLRKRTEDALEQKWQYEKGLSGIKMDLDRAELETRGLRIILQEHDILGSSQLTRLGNGQDGQGADQQLQESISTAESERDQARQVAQEYRQRAQTVKDGSSAELNNSAKRMDELADQLEKQVQSNIELRARLAKAVARGEQEQRESNGKIGEMQKRLANMEDSVLAAQQHSETTLGTHEAEVRKLEEASTPALQRLRVSGAYHLSGAGVVANRRLTPTSPLVVKSPKLGSKKLSDNSLLEMSKTQMLERKVKELEALLREAEEDMQDVVQKVNKSQLEVAELQTERDAAFSQMRKLQTLIGKERERADALMR